MLSTDIIIAVKSYTQNMTNKVTVVLQTGEHEKRAELVEFLRQICSVSAQLTCVERDDKLRSPVSFYLEVEGQHSGISFSGIPSGHEFNSLILAILQLSGTPLKLDNSLIKMVKKIKERLHFEVFISLTCHNCPDVVQSLNQFSLLNDSISTEMIDGGLFQALVNERNIQGVPSVYLNGELFANGKIDTAQLVDKLVKRYPYIIEKNENKEQELQDVTVIGGGPAGVAAAIYAARKGLKVTMIADRVGGQVKDTLGIENLISVVKTTGTELTNNMQAHLNDYDIKIKSFLRVEKIEKGTIKKLHLSNGELIDSKTVIVATGAKWRELGVPGEKDNIGSGVAYCPHCDGPFFKGKEVAVVGGGNSGIEAALDLAIVVNHVTVFEFLPELKADQVLIDKAQANPKITIVKSAATKEVIAQEGKVVALAYEDRNTGEIKNHNLSGIFVQIGLVPNSGFLNGVVECSQYGEVVIDEKCQTTESGIFAAGDVTTVPYKQIVIAMGEGSKAALSAFEYLIRSN
ncbi:MAG: alkyl hydroperoxide reductase subunit F [Litorilituus sp.]|nr:alkyl hydroperoxide reductase subunit F [Litorilituus sp.]